MFNAYCPFTQGMCVSNCAFNCPPQQLTLNRTTECLIAAKLWDISPTQYQQLEDIKSLIPKAK